MSFGLIRYRVPQSRGTSTLLLYWVTKIQHALFIYKSIVSPYHILNNMLMS